MISPVIDSPYKGNASLTREQFLFYEMRITAKLKYEGLDEESIVARITEENLFQYPTERMVRRIAQTCIHRLNALNSDYLISAIAFDPSDVSKQIVYMQ